MDMKFLKSVYYISLCFLGWPMRYNRNESFRYEFECPKSVTFKITDVNGKKTETNLARAKIKNISPHGMRLLSDLDIKLKGSIKADFTFSLHSTQITVKGTFVWQRKELHGYSYGIEIETTKEVEKMIVEELKQVSKGTVYIKGK